MEPISSQTSQQPAPARREARPRPAKPLPTDRVKLGLQIRILRAVGRLGTDKKPIPQDRLSDAIDKAAGPASVMLSHSFFTDCGWLTRVGRGEYTASDALVKYSRILSADSNGHVQANAVLRSTAVNGWFWPVILPLIEHGPAPRSEVMVALMTAAEVGEAHKPQVSMLLDWLRYIDMIDVDDDEKVSLVVPPAPDQRDEAELHGGTPAATRPAGTQPDAEQQQKPPASNTSVSESTIDRTPPAIPVLAFDFTFELTADDLAKLSPEQIKAVYEAVGSVMAIKAISK